MIQVFELLPGVTLRCFPDRRFKQGYLSIQLVRTMCREEAAMNALLPAILLRGTVNSPDLRSITLRLDDLYGAAVGALVRRIGDYQTTGLHCGFIDDQYALKGDAILAPMMDFLREILLEPVLEDGVFRKDFVESEKKNLTATIESQRNDKRIYASNQMYKSMCKADSYGIPRLGEIEDVSAITAETLYAHYQKILRRSPIEIFYVGSADPQILADLLRDLFRQIPRQPDPLPAQTGFHDGGGADFTEQLDVTQGKLCMGFVTPITLRSPDFVVMQVFNTLFGAGMTSKLFMQIREAQSLCYDIGSSYQGSKGILTVFAGIDNHQDTLVRREIMVQLDACCRGDITDGELTAAKQALIMQLQGVHDSPGSIEGYYATGVLNEMRMTPEQHMAAVSAVTQEDVARVAAMVTLHTVYFLKGVS